MSREIWWPCLAVRNDPSLPFPHLRNLPCIGAGPRQGRALRPEGASEPKGSLDGWLRCNTKGDEGMAGSPAVVQDHRTAGSVAVCFVRPVRPASIRTFDEPLGLVPVGVLDYFRVLPSKERPSAHRRRRGLVQPTGAVTRTRRYVHPRLPCVFPGPSHLAHPNSRLVLPSSASAARSSDRFHPRRLAVAQRFVYFARRPQVMQQHGQLACHRHARLLLGPFPTSCR